MLTVSLVEDDDTYRELMCRYISGTHGLRLASAYATAEEALQRFPREKPDVALVDISRGLSILGVMGPRSRDLLSRVTDADLSNSAFPFLTSQAIGIGKATVRAVRITYVGELGWELHVPMDQAVTVYETLMAAGKDLGIANAGHYAINSLRLEKGYRAWGAELSPDDTPLEAGLAFAIDWAKPFLGREALEQQKKAGVNRRLVIFVLADSEPILWGGEPILRDGQPVGYTTSGAYGHTLGGAVAMGYVNHPEAISDEFIRAASYEINVSGRKYPAKSFLRPPYDPQRIRILA